MPVGSAARRLFRLAKAPLPDVASELFAASPSTATNRDARPIVGACFTRPIGLREMGRPLGWAPAMRWFPLFESHGAKVVNAKITTVTVSTPFQTLVVEPHTIMGSLDQYREILNARHRSVGVACYVMHVEHEHPYHGIIDAATKGTCDLIVMVSHARHGVSVILLGSETAKMLTHCTIPVLVFAKRRSTPITCSSLDLLLAPSQQTAI